MDRKNGVAAAAVIAAGVIISSLVLSNFFVRVKHEQGITVKGFAKEVVVSDIGKLGMNITVRSQSLEQSYEDITRSAALVRGKLEENGVTAAEISMGSPQSSKIFRRDARGQMTNEIEYYQMYQYIEVISPDVRKMGDLSEKLMDVVRQGVDLTVHSPRYYISDLSETKQRLLEAATRDGLDRARALAENSGSSVGKLRSARQGVFQITTPNSTETSGYGMYDTSTIEKSVKAVVTLEYGVK